MFRSLFLAVLLVVAVISPSWGEMTLVYPAANSWVRRSDYLILKMNTYDLTGIRITVNGAASDLLPIGTPEYKKAFQDMLILQAAWDKGKNTVVIDTFKGETKIESKSADIFYYPEGDPAEIPKEYKANTMHVPEKERLCAPCHFMQSSPPVKEGEAGTVTPCYRCHKKMLSTPYVHGPTGTFSCTVCHAQQGNPKYGVPKRDAALCGDCHADQVKDMQKKKFVHGPIEAGMCELCHDPHGSSNLSFLRQPVNQLCLSCHEPIGSEIHVTRTPTGKGHPLSGYPDPSHPGSGRELSCVSCHNPHGGNVRYFFRNNAESRMDLCQLCHNK